MNGLGRPYAAALTALALSSCSQGNGAPPSTGGRRPLLASLAHDAHIGPAGASGGPTKALGPEASTVTFERMGRYPEPGWHVPREIAFSPDGRRVTFLQSESQTDRMALYAFDLQTRTSSVIARAEDLLKNERPLSREEELRRERQRQRARGISSYVWAKRADLLVVPLGGDVFARSADGKFERLTDTAEPEIDPKPCADGQRIGFVRGSELVMIDVATRRETALTKGAPEGVTRGQSDFNGQEEFDESSGFWWSPTCDRIAYLEVDERDVATTPVLGFRDRAPDLMMQRYPAAGAKNPRVRVGVLDVKTKKTTWLRGLGTEQGAGYAARFAWSPDGKALFFETLSRNQQELQIERADPTTGEVRPLAKEGAPTWLEFGDLHPLEKSPRLLRTMRTAGGHTHLALCDARTGPCGPPITEGDWDVTSLEAVDEDRGLVWFSATKDSPLERHLYMVPLAEVLRRA